MANAVRLCIRNKSDIIDIVTLINGHFRTPKIKALHRLIDRVSDLNWVKMLPEGKNGRHLLEKKCLKNFS